MSDLKQAEFKGGAWTRRPLSIRDDGWDGVANLFRRLFRRPLEMVWVFESEPITLAPGETRAFLFPAPPPAEDTQ